MNWENLHREVAKQGGTLPQQGNATQNQNPSQAPTQQMAQSEQSPPQ